MNYHHAKNSYQKYFLLAVLLLLFSGCLREQAPVNINETATPRSEISTISPTSSRAITQSVSPTSTQAQISIINSNERIAYLFTGAHTSTSLNGKATILDRRGNNLTEIDLDCLFCNSLSWSPSGQWFAYSAYQDLPGNTDIYLVRVDNGQIKRITNTTSSKIDVTWTPDEKSLTYVDDTETADIVNLNLDTGSLSKLTTTQGIESNPSWSPDGSRLAFIYRPRREDPGELWMMQSDGKNRELVTDISVSISQISWSPDGKHIAFTSPQECGNIYTIDIESHRSSKLTNSASCVSNPVWSPDGNSIAFFEITYDPTNTAWMKSWSIKLMDMNGNNIISIQSSSEYLPLYLAWSPVPTLQFGRTYTISHLGTNLNLRESPSLKSNVIEKLKEANVIKILSGPVQADDYYWWLVSTNDNLQGWVADVSGWYLLNQ